MDYAQSLLFFRDGDPDTLNALLLLGEQNFHKWLIDSVLHHSPDFSPHPGACNLDHAYMYCNSCHLEHDPLGFIEEMYILGFVALDIDTLLFDKTNPPVQDGSNDVRSNIIQPNGSHVPDVYEKIIM